MIMVKPAVTFIILFLSIDCSYAQVQKDMTDYLRQKFIRYTETVFREEIFVHIDRDTYIAGEDIWFNLYLIDRKSNKPVFDDKIAYFELLSPENLPIIQKKIFIDKASGSGHMVLPDTLSSGTYTIRAYTSWMKNFLPYNCYMKDIEVYNALIRKPFRRKIYSDDSVSANKPEGINSGRSGSGLKVSSNNSGSGMLELIIRSDPEFRSDYGNMIYILIHTHGILNHISSVIISDDTAIIRVPESKLLTGVNHITLFDTGLRPLAERFIYTPQKYNELLKMNTSLKYKTREKIVLDLEIENKPGVAVDEGRMSISVSPLIADSHKTGIDDYLLFGSEFGIKIQKITGSKKPEEYTVGFIDSLLLSARSNWIDWDKVLARDQTDLKYPVERKDHFLTGRLISADREIPVDNKYILLSSPGKVATFQYARTDNLGNFGFKINIDESVSDLIIQPDDPDDKYRISIESPFSLRYAHSEVFSDSAGGLIPSHVLKQGINYQVNKIYETSFSDSKIVADTQPVKSFRFYGKPDIGLVMSDYITLPVMEEVFQELLPGVLLKRKKTVCDLTIIDPVTRRNFGFTPGMLVDGVIIKDPSIIAGLDPELVERIDVIKSNYMVGIYVFHGIVSLITKAGDYSNVKLPDYAVRMPYRVIDPVGSFKSPDYSGSAIMEEHIPDFRNTLYWDPSIKPDKNGNVRIEFYASDIVSEYEIAVEGISGEGKMISLKKIIRVE
ncbi:MAG: hypothetical protein A2X05_11270 [Bacteroidetes bacterium GWE2_41_25]|nr:MAG: hypothetical protein A2X03_13675 [Bacteroidetes bacterium GWA2_40_15]OFX93492.1 MAG: hypothetical protein A2X06_11145 [Bacteroidetes bacterium GWC2_40_22]OFX96084.1 MAG: hypothetical protein A2X05_11270 [Bacteroidetes bacterium GWE2_41_25]OFY59118.1 MAG: hypothetical protein A2X04_09605 [Bacteroidetes bacterium GWF2_41_9]HAM09410.1 hypothetical protein [Bacteroidales bacterium]